MRVDAASARTWLLAAIAGWAVLAWALAVLGMGGRIAPLADDPGRIKPIPALPAAYASRLGPIAQYAEIGARPLFSVDRRPKPFSLQGDVEGSDASDAFDYLLTGVLLTPHLQMATLQSPDGSRSERVKLGEAPESHPDWRLSALNARSAVFDGPGEQRTVELRAFDGTGGQPPTAVSREGQPPGAIAMPEPPQSNGNGGAPRPATTPAATTAPSAPAAPARAPGAAADAPAATEQAQMEAIRQRIQARRAQMREQAQPTQPPAQDK